MHLKRLLIKLSILKWTLYLPGAALAFRACTSIWMCRITSQFMICITGLEIGLPDSLEITNKGGLPIVLLAAGTLLLALLTSVSRRIPKYILLASALVLVILVAYAAINLQRSHHLIPGTTYGTLVNFEIVNELIAGALLMLLGAVWDTLASRGRLEQEQG